MPPASAMLLKEFSGLDLDDINAKVYIARNLELSFISLLYKPSKFQIFFFRVKEKLEEEEDLLGYFSCFKVQRNNFN